MKMSKWEKLNITTSKLGFGAMRLPYVDGEIEQSQVNDMVKYAFDNGVNYYDTAYVYGKNGASEIALGKALKQFKREDFYIADKMPFFETDGEDYLNKTFATSLERLDVDYIDFYLMHCLDKSKVSKIRTLEAVKWAIQKKKEGKIKYIGFSIHDDADTLMDILSLHDWDFAQIQYNYMDLNDAPGEKGYKELVKRNIPIIIMEPLKGGMLANIPDDIAKPFRNLNGSNVSFGFRWLIGQEGIVTILSGMSSMQQVKDNIDIFSDIKPLNEDEKKAVLEVEKNLKATQKIGCTGCSYCMPCAKGVNIPQLFKSWNTKALHKSTNWISGTEIDYENAELCIGCGLCSKKCPQRFDIPSKIKELLKEKEEVK